MKYLSIAMLAAAVLFLIACRKHNDAPYPYNYYSIVPDTNRFVVPNTHTNTNGYKVSYYPNSNIKSAEGNYENGHASGYWKMYYSNGRLMREGNYSNGQLSGYWKFYYANGYKKEEGNYQNNIKSGNWIYYYSTGIVSAQGNYSNGVKEGEWSYYNTDGTLYYKTND